VPGGVQGWDRYAYVSNSPMMYVDPSGHSQNCGPDGVLCDDDPSNDHDYDPGVQLSAAGAQLLAFANKNGISVDSVIQAGLAGEANGFSQNPEALAKAIEAWGRHYQWFVNLSIAEGGCGGLDTLNCRANFFMLYSSSVRDLVIRNRYTKKDEVQRITSPLWFRNEYVDNWAAGGKLYDAIRFPKPEWIAYDLYRDRDRPFDVEVKPVSVVITKFGTTPTIGTGYNQFLWWDNALWNGPAYSVIMSYCQWQWWGGNVAPGCIPAESEP
jgi:hypothetical protein